MQNILFGGGGAANPNPKQSQESAQKIEDVQTDLLTQLKVFSVGVSPMEELGLKYNSNNIDDLNQLRTILSKKLTYPSAYVADTHVRANRLGFGDIHQPRQYYEQNPIITENTRFCICCGFMEQEETLALSQDLSQIDHIGISTYLLFTTIKHLAYLLTMMLVVFSIYALITNKTASNIYQADSAGKSVSDEELSYQGLVAFSTGSKQIHNNSYGNKTLEIQCWLGVAMISVWALIFIYIKYRERNIEYEVDEDSMTASDFSLMFENMPKGITPPQLQQQLLEYQHQMQEYYRSPFISPPISVVKINEATPFYLDENSFDDEQLELIDKQYEKCKEQLVDLIKEREDSDTFKTPKDERQKLYDRFDELKKKRIQRYGQITKQIVQQKKAQSKHYGETVPAFVTFSHSFNKQFLQRVHDDSSYKFIYKLPCFTGRRKFFHFPTQDGGKKMAIIREAPEPEDIIWTNLGQSTGQAIKKKLITFFVTLVLLCISFFVIYGLSIVQILVAKTLTKQEQHVTNIVVSTFISLVISFFNIIINQILSFLTKYERNPTYIDEQTSLGLKAALAVLVNTILIPILVTRYLRSNLYGVGGLADDVFYLSITNAFLTPVLKIFNASYYLYRLMRWYFNRPYPRLPLSQNQLHARSQFMEFSIGYEYVYMVNLFLFTCFFVSLQPIIVVFAIAGLFFFFWTLKYHLFNRCKRPTPGYTSINTAMYQLIFLGPMFYTLGSFCWSHFFQDEDKIAPTPNIVALIISAVIFVLPYKKVIKVIFDQMPQKDLLFEENRIYLPSEYDRLNPLTASKASKQYLEYISNYRADLSKKTSKQIEEVTYLINRQCGAGHRHQRNLMPRFGNVFGFSGAGLGGVHGGIEEQQLIKQFLGGAGDNTVNPFIIGNSILPIMGGRGRSSNGKMQINMPTQNWLTGEEVSYNRSSQMHTDPAIDIGGLLNPDQGETVTYQNIGGRGRGGRRGRGGHRGGPRNLNLNFGSLIKEGIMGQKGMGNDQNNSQIPVNLPLNLFGNMMNLDPSPKDQDWANWHRG